MPMPDVRITHIDLTAFFVSVECLRDPALAGKPIMVAGPADKRGVVTCASYEVRKYGVRAGMATALAQKKCPIAIRVDGHRNLYEEYSQRVRKYLRQYAPEFEAASIDEFYIDWTGCEKLFRTTLINFARKIQRDILQSIGLPCAIGIGSNKIISKIACDRAKPDGVIEVATGDEADFLKALDVSVLPGVGKVMKENLYLRGIHTCGELAALNEMFVQERFGAWGLHVQAYARGEGSQTVGGTHEQKQISSEETFERDTDDMKFLHAVLHRMAFDLSEQLRRNDLQSRCIHLKLR
ncbi:DNA polymerase IV, partial [bacterium]|nr:DNA polymerase IV [bacterium]